MSGAISEYLPEIDSVHLNGGVNATAPEKQKAMTDVLVSP